MNSRTIVTEIAAAGALIGSYPLYWIRRRAEQYHGIADSEPVILAHGFGGNRSNLLALAAYLRLARFDNVTYCQYPRWQSIEDSAAELGHLVEEKGGATGVHLIGHSLGGTIARRYAADAPAGAIRSLITLGSPYSYGQRSPQEIGIFGDDDPIVPALSEAMMPPGAVASIVGLRAR